MIYVNREGDFVEVFNHHHETERIYVPLNARVLPELITKLFDALTPDERRQVLDQISP